MCVERLAASDAGVLGGRRGDDRTAGNEAAKTGRGRRGIRPGDNPRTRYGDANICTRFEPACKAHCVSRRT